MVLPFHKFQCTGPRMEIHQGNGEISHKENFNTTHHSEEQIKARQHFIETKQSETKIWNTRKKFILRE